MEVHRFDAPVDAGARARFGAPIRALRHAGRPIEVPFLFDGFQRAGRREFRSILIPAARTADQPERDTDGSAVVSRWVIVVSRG
nr:hypothetical protein KitaXyl93_50920 [Kitasatospora sp. Xyl93]